MVPFRLAHRIIGRQGNTDPDRQRKLDLGRLDISFTSGRPMPLGFGVFLIRVSVYLRGSVSHDTSNYRADGENGPDQQREL